MSDTTPESTAELVRDLSEQMSRLVSQELALAKAEVSEKGKRAGIGAGMFGGAGVVGLYALGALIAAIIALLATAMDTWIAALIVTVVLGAIAGVLALMGKKQVQQAVPPQPERAVASVKKDTETLKSRAQAGRNGS